jgi:hypothetical protein
LIIALIYNLCIAIAWDRTPSLTLEAEANCSETKQTLQARVAVPFPVFETQARAFEGYAYSGTGNHRAEVALRAALGCLCLCKPYGTVEQLAVHTKETNKTTMHLRT